MIILKINNIKETISKREGYIRVYVDIEFKGEIKQFWFETEEYNKKFVLIE